MRNALRSLSLLAVVTSHPLAPQPLFAQTATVARLQSSEDGLVSLLHTTKAGITLNYVEQGDPKGPVIVLLHGAGDSWHSYDRVFPLIPYRFHVYAITLRGHGLSDHPEKGFSSMDFAGDILDFLDAKNIHHATLVGHSLGSFVAQKVAKLDNGHLDRLVLIGSGPGLVDPSKEQTSVLSSFSTLKDPISYTFARDFQASTIYFPVPARYFELWVAEAQRVPAATWRGLSQGHKDPASDLKNIHIPTLVLWGEKDSIFKRADEDLLVRTLPHAQFSAYAETGHALHWERPERFTRELLAFIRSSNATNKSAAHPL
ncbi:alpha/beta hydrolase [Granulicella sp. dw_53]|uniref:alpha/beta fold hydrolase n=1 Tax=Granulicella sp. dw_53 TaxID=2719792 RepID=UPI001BD3C96B|nr:alpha/beta hydrolase [Granulicella sp. dw_53]